MRTILAIAILGLCGLGPQALPVGAQTRPTMVAACGRVVDSELALRRLPAAERAEKLACLAREIARELDSQPSVRSGELPLYRVRAEGSRLIYHLRLRPEPSEVRAARLAAARGAWRDRICGGRFMSSFVSMGGSVMAVFEDSDGRPVDEILIAEC
jgi:hypothetical protein